MIGRVRLLIAKAGRKKWPKTLKAATYKAYSSPVVLV